MRAITGAVVSSEPCSLHKAVLDLRSFSKSAASHLPSSDCDSYLRTLTNVTIQLSRFRDKLGDRHQQGAANFDAHDYEDPVEGNRSYQDQESKGRMTVAAGGCHRDSAAGVELDLASGKKKRKKKKNENPPEERVARKKNKHEQEEGDTEVVKEKTIADGDLDREKKRKKKREEGDTEVVKEKTIADGDLDREKKRKKKRGRGDIYDNGLEQVENIKKKQKKHSGD